MKIKFSKNKTLRNEIIMIDNNILAYYLYALVIWMQMLKIYWLEFIKHGLVWSEALFSVYIPIKF